jgi:hypothetical protein
MDNDPKQENALNALLDATKAGAPSPSADFMARLQGDMEQAVPRPPTRAAASAPTLLSRLGGLFAASGLTGAAMLGVWIGFVMPETLNMLADGFSTDQTVSLDSLLPGADLIALSD